MTGKWKVQLIYFMTVLAVIAAVPVVWILLRNLSNNIESEKWLGYTIAIIMLLGPFLAFLMVFTLPVYVSLIVAKRMGWSKNSAEAYFYGQGKKAGVEAWVGASLNAYATKKLINKVYNNRS